ncbi:hypothetical protein BDF21DRAFT_497599 [Thamnidium elegans]|uniref:Uncharacterized protein n=1 Tax=Thamnidium elegans TaxID=101142 RepID=A0A8H7VRX4_9FUNG|nr:hypothetical protein INT48_005178 [Thamnidium elegans]KAI8058876.1 hypothetical protein BDF21DRAFT_497599 [Thamnidium elegans]
MLCDAEKSFSCPDTVCGNIRFSVCSWSNAADGTVVSESCSDTSNLNCANTALQTCFRLRVYVATDGVNDTLPVGNQFAVCENIDETLPIPKITEAIPTRESAATLNQASFILALMFICLLTVSLSRKF